MLLTLHIVLDILTPHLSFVVDFILIYILGLEILGGATAISKIEILYSGYSIYLYFGIPYSNFLFSWY